MKTKNQCDGCKRGLPVDYLNIHRDPEDSYPYMVCTKKRYEKNKFKCEERTNLNVRREQMNQNNMLENKDYQCLFCKQCVTPKYTPLESILLWSLVVGMACFIVGSILYGAFSLMLWMVA